MANLTPNSAYSIKIRLELPNQPGMLAKTLEAIAKVGGNVGEIDLIEQTTQTSIRELVVDAASTAHATEIIAAIQELAEFKLISHSDRTFDLHKRGKISIESRISVQNRADLSMAYTPGVGRVCQAIHEDPQQVYQLTIKGNTVAVVTDGSAVLGLGNLGAEAALPVMEGKALLFKEFAGVDAFPICLTTQDTEEIINTVVNIAPVFGGINLEDISAPRCFEIEARLREILNIPVFHDDQHGTAIVTLAALINALQVVNKSIESVKIVFNGAGAAGIAVAKLLQQAGVSNIWMCDSKGIISSDRTDLTPAKQAFAISTSGKLADAMVDADVFIGLSGPGLVTPEMVRSMATDRILFAMANPTPEIQPELVKDDVAVMATGRSDYPNQINNVLAFPGVFRGALDSRAPQITDIMCLAAAKAIASLIPTAELTPENIVPSVFDKRVATVVAEAVKQVVDNR
ncbi:NAD-dependent malic enzyme [Merismopedia glauca]|uniref:NAD-dependent malic enzyme n=1 Tax=Merismopedia glauca CCAP 1448/3 TaxID=1296344 RepID=A0A2T1C5A4_9CYAN|nr:NAD-dependent malic enzyme [Merismopedia glauca]PSB03465.1 NAD-dependent malic enzyme [Merismopedia glauca CCAP 1448/3]